MSKLTEMYGEFQDIYSGSGSLNGNACEFEIGQLSNGTIRVCCTSCELWTETDQFELEGATDCSNKVSASGKTILVKAPYTLSRDAPVRAEYYYKSAGEFRVDIGKTSWEHAHRIRFSIANFEFIGNKLIEVAPDHVRRALLGFELDEINCAFIQVEDYDEKIAALSARKGVEITCHLEVEIDGRSRDEILKLAKAVCTLLSIARGTKINWISYKLFDFNSQLLCHRCEPRITVPYTSIVLVKSAIIPKCTIDFLTQCYPTYKERNSLYHFDDIGNFLVDIHSRGFLETRCLLLFSVAEVLTRSSSNSDMQLKRLRDFADEHDVPVEKCRLKKCGRGCGACSPKCKECKIRCEPNCEIGKFIQDRNEFVHKMRFPIDNTTEGYFRNLSFLHRMILSALNFRGEFYDWSKGEPGWE